MRALSIGGMAALVVVFHAAAAAAAPSQTFPFSCEIDLNELLPADVARNVPENQRGKAYLETGEKKCTFSANNNTQIRCETVVDDWPNPRNITIKNFVEPCQWFLEEAKCGVDATVVADNQTFKIKRINSNTASLELVCKGTP